MAKAKLSDESKQILADLRNRIRQLNELNQRGKDKHPELSEYQERAFLSVLALLDQIEEAGQIYRGNDYVPDAIEPLATTKWKPQTKLI